jgi:hypothetical protein
MGLNPYFNESRSNLDYHEVVERVENNINVYERSTAHWYAIANARSIGKPVSFHAKSTIFETTRPGQLHLPRYVDPTFEKWTNTHYTNEAIVGTDNVEGAKLNYQEWHQGQGLMSAADEAFVSQIRGVAHDSRIQRLKDLQAGVKIPDIRKFTSTNSAAAVVKKLHELRTKLDDPTYLPNSDEIPTPEQLNNIEVFKEECKQIEQAFAGISTSSTDIEEREATRQAVASFLRVGSRTNTKVDVVQSSMQSLWEQVKNNPSLRAFGPAYSTPDVVGIGPASAPIQPQTRQAASVTTSGVTTTTETDADSKLAEKITPTAETTKLADELAAVPPKSATPVAPAPAAPAVPAAPAAPAPAAPVAPIPPAAPPKPAVPAPAPAPAPVPVAVPPKPTAPKPTAPAPVPAPAPAPAPVPPSKAPSKVPGPPVKLPPTEDQNFKGKQPGHVPGDILHFSGKDIAKIPANLFHATLGELNAMDENQLHAFERRYNELERAGTLAAELKAPSFVSGFRQLAEYRKENSKHGYKHPGSDYYGENTSPMFNAFLNREPILRLKEQRHREGEKRGGMGELEGGMPPRRRASAAAALALEEGAETEEAPLTEQEIEAISTAIANAKVKMDRPAIERVARATHKALRAQETAAANTVPMTLPSKAKSANDVVDEVKAKSRSVSASGSLMGKATGALAAAGLTVGGLTGMLAANGGPDTADYTAANQIMTPFSKLMAQGIGYVPAAILGATGQALLPYGSHFLRTVTGYYSVHAVVKFLAGSNINLSNGLIAGVFDLATNTIQSMYASYGAMRKNITLQSAINAGELEAARHLAPDIKDFTRAALEHDLRKRYDMQPVPPPTDMPAEPAAEPANATAAPSPAAPPPTASAPPPPVGGKRYERGDLTKEEVRAQKRIKRSKMNMAEELDSDSECMDEEGGVAQNKTDILSSMKHRGLQARIPDGFGEAMPLLYGGVEPGDLPEDDAQLLGKALALALTTAMDLTERNLPFDPFQVGQDAWEATTKEALMDSSDRQVVLETGPAAAPPSEDQYLNVPGSAVDAVAAPAEAPIEAPAEALPGPVPAVPGPAVGGALTMVGGGVIMQTPPPIQAGTLVGGGVLMEPPPAAAMAGGNLAEDLAQKVASEEDNAANEKMALARKTIAEGETGPSEKMDLARKAMAGGEKPKRKVSEWSLLIQKVFRELREKDPLVTIAMAAKEASRRRKGET